MSRAKPADARPEEPPPRPRRRGLAAVLVAATALAALLAWGFWSASREAFDGAGRAGPRREDGKGTAEPASSGRLGGWEPERSRGADLLLITVDTLRADALGFAGKQGAATPTLDRLAATGRVFRRAHAHNVMTLPSHANILSGLYPYQHGIRDNSGFRLGAAVPTLATVLQEAGYATAAVVGAFPLDARFGLDRGFDLYDDRYPSRSDPTALVVDERRGDEVVETGRRWWRRQAGRKRFLWIHLYDPHAPYAPPDPFASRFPGDPYQGEVAASDAFLAPLLDPFLAGERPPTLVVFTADHGEALGDHGELTHGLFAYEAVLRVPLVVWGPGIAPADDDRWAGHVDLMPTILAALGVEPPDGLPGRSLTDPAPLDRPLYFEALSAFLNRGWAPLRGILEDGSKFIDLPVAELYDLPEDPEEARNLVREERRLAAELRRQIPAEGEWPPRRGAVPSEEAARLRGLGYLSGSAVEKSRFGPGDDPKNLIHLDRKLHRVIDLYSRGRLAEAEALGRELVEEAPDLPPAYEHLAFVLREQERLAEAAAVLREAVARGAATPSLQRQLGLTLAEAGRPLEAIAVLEPLAGAGELESLLALGVAYSDAGRQGDAGVILRRALDLDPENARALETLGLAALRADQPREARALLERALDRDEGRPVAWNTLGVALFRLGRKAEAVAAWERAVALDPRRLDALFNLGLTAAEVGRPELAREALSRFASTAPADRYAEDIVKAQRLLERLGER